MSRFKDIFAGNSNSGDKTTAKKLLVPLVTSLLLLVARVSSDIEYSGQTSTLNIPKIVYTACSSTLYPKLCHATLADSLRGERTELKSTKDVITASLKATILTVRGNYFVLKKLIDAPGGGNHTRREREALRDCLETIDDTLDELNAAVEDLKVYPHKKSIERHADDLKTLLSAAITNQETCVDGFSHSRQDKHDGEVLVDGRAHHVEKLCSNSLAMLTNMTAKDMADERNKQNNAGRRRKLLGGGAWPEWLSVADRKLLQSPSVTPDAVVAVDGSGDFKTVMEAVAAAPEKSDRRHVIRIKAGVYRENVEVTKKKWNVMFVGDGRTSTIITGNRNVQDGSTTFKSATVAVVGQGFLARDITFQNTAGPSKHQAVALRVGSDLSAFYNCDILAYQDTLYVHSNRQFFVNCLIAGTVDFIFGNGAAVLQDCDIHARRPGTGQKNMVTAQGRTDPNQNTGIVIQNCRIGATSDLAPVQSSFPTYLGRPWKEYSRTVVMQSTITNVIEPVGWHEWNGKFALDTLYYGEYQNTGAGADTSGRVKWGGYKVITSATEAGGFTAGRFIAGGSWLSSTGFPFSLGL